MPRHARKYLDTSFFHVMVQGINKEKIFKKNRYMNEYANLLNKNLKEFDLSIVAFCIMTNHAHLLVHVENIEELSAFMHKVNSSYARYFNYMEGERVGYVFRDRYKSEPIRDRKYLIQCAKYIHQNPVKAGIVKSAGEYKFSSFNYFKRHINNHNIFTKEEIAYICNESIPSDTVFMDIDTNSEEIIKYGIEEFIKKENIKTFEIFENRDILKLLIKFLKENKKIKYVEIRKELEITRGTMDGLK